MSTHDAGWVPSLPASDFETVDDSTIQQHCCLAAVFDVDVDPFQKKKKTIGKYLRVASNEMLQEHLLYSN